MSAFDADLQVARGLVKTIQQQILLHPMQMQWVVYQQLQRQQHHPRQQQHQMLEVRN